MNNSTTPTPNLPESVVTELLALSDLSEKATGGLWGWSLNGNIVTDTPKPGCDWEIAAVYTDRDDDLEPANAAFISTLVNWFRSQGWTVTPKPELPEGVPAGPFYFDEQDSTHKQHVYFTADQLHAYASESVAYWHEMWRAANARAEGLEADARRYRAIRGAHKSLQIFHEDDWWYGPGSGTVDEFADALIAAIDAAQAVRSEASEGDKS
jgi:hypothetical protein